MDNPYSNITELIMKDLSITSALPIQNFRLIRAKSGVYVYNCMYGETPAVVKYFEKESDRREILNYQILARQNIPTIDAMAFGQASLVMENLSALREWRLGREEDFEDVAVAKSLAQWYFTLHENGSFAQELDTLYFEYDSITEENLKILMQKLPEAKELFQFVMAHQSRLDELIRKPAVTLTYNDFYWSNFIVQNDKKAAIMFDYNLLGKGYRFSDFQNVCWSISDASKAAFTGEYNRLYVEKHGHSRADEEKREEQIVGIASPLFSLIVAFIENKNFPHWAEPIKEEALNGSLLSKARQLLLATPESPC